jgi:hypothetical protein
MSLVVGAWGRVFRAWEAGVAGSRTQAMTVWEEDGGEAVADA